MLDICTILFSQEVTEIFDEVELHIHFKFPKAVKLCQFLNFSQMWYVACPQDLMDFPLAGLIQPRTYFCYMFGEFNMFQPKISTVVNNLLFALSLSCFLLKWKNEWDKKNAVSPHLSKKGRWKNGIGLGQNTLGILSHLWLKYSQAVYYCSFEQQNTSAFLFKSTLQCWKTDKTLGASWGLKDMKELCVTAWGRKKCVVSF